MSETVDGTYSNGSISADLSGLPDYTTFYYKAFLTVQGTGDHISEEETFYGSEKSFTTLENLVPNGWLELPAAYIKSAISSTTTSTLNDLIERTHYISDRKRNYSFLYDPEMYASYWVAYPLAKEDFSSGRNDSFGYDPDIAQNKQTNISGTYGVSYSPTSYSSNSYARGHQVPNADRNANATAQAQTYYATNMTPQIQNGFNGGIWAKLEAAVRDQATTTDTVYVVTGAAFKKVNGSESITRIVNSNDSKSLPVPNYYWKVLLKVKRNGAEITSASAIGFWLPHQEITTGTYADYVQSVDQIEAWTGFNFFANLPKSKEAAAERNTSWTTFQNF